MSAASIRRGIAVAAGLVIAIATMLMVLRPLSIATPAAGLDGSWIAVVGEAAILPARWGVDLAFSYGPASDLMTRFYTDTYLIVALPLLCGVALVQGASVAWLVRNAVAGRRFGTPLLLLATVAEVMGLGTALTQDQDSFFFALSLTLVLVALVRRPGDRISLIILASGAAVMGALAIAKTSYAVTAFMLFVIADARAALASKRVPLPTLVFLAAVSLAYLAHGQRIGDLPAYLDLQSQVAAGYGEAMYLAPSHGEVAAFLFAAALLVVAVACCAPARTGRIGRASAALATAFVLAIGFKAGFVRADGHTQIAWSALGLSGLAVGFGLAPQRSMALAAALGVASLAVLWVVTPLFLTINPNERAEGELPATYGDMAAAFESEVGAWARFLRSPDDFAAGARAAKASALAALRAAHPLPALAGGVDILPSEQSTVLASGLDFHPRPSFQEYATYTAGLIAANLDFYAGPNAPAWVLFGLGSLEDRDPMSSEGALWPSLLRRYEPTRRLGEWLALHRRPTPLPNVLGAALRVEAPLGSVVRVPIRGPVFAHIAVTKTLLGRLAAMVFRPPALSLRLKPVGKEEEQTFRFIPAIGEGGFLLSPVLNDPDGFALLGIGAGDVADGVAVESFVVGGSRWSGLFYDATMRVEFQPVTVAPPSASPEAKPLFDDLTADLPWRRLVHDLGRELVGNHLSAQPPTALAIPTAGARRIRLGFGIEDGAWKEGRTQGVCFAIKTGAAAAEPLWHRCLDPAAEPADRGRQEAEVDLPPATAAVTAETTCPKGCSWGWSYWTRIGPEAGL